MNDEQEFWYSIQVGGDLQDSPINPKDWPVGYNSSGVIKIPRPPDWSMYNETPFGESGTRLRIFGSGSPYSPTVSLAFETAIDYTQPLPLDRFSAADSSWELDFEIYTGPKNDPIHSESIYD